MSAGKIKQPEPDFAIPQTRGQDTGEQSVSDHKTDNSLLLQIKENSLIWRLARARREVESFCKKNKIMFAL